MIQRLIYDSQVNDAILKYARDTGVREDVAFEKARDYAREIVPSFSATAYFGFAIRVARWLSKAMFDVRLEHHDGGALRKIDQDATLIYVMNHRSNMDYLLVTYLAAHSSALAYAVGEWARVWPLSGLIRSMGAYFIRRKSRDGLYRRVLARYVAMATEGGINQAMFPEGGLSLTGGPAAPKVGLLKYIVDGWREDGRNVVFVPVALNYDRVLEDRILIAADKSGERKFRGHIGEAVGFFARHIWKRMFGKFQHFGKAAVSFGVPVDLGGFIGAHGRSPEKLGAELMTRIEAAVPVVPVPLVAYCLQAGARSEAEIVLMARERFYRSPESVKSGIAGLKLRRLIAEEAGEIRILPEQADLVAFYARSIAHLAGGRAALAR